MEIKAEIAKINVCFTHVHESYFNEAYSEYLSDFAVPDLRLKFNNSEKTVPPGELIFTDGTVTLKELKDGSRLLYQMADEKNILYSLNYNSDCSSIDVYFSNKYRPFGVPFEIHEFGLATMAYNMKLIQQGGLMFHSSCIEIDGKAICFSAPSGTGKSTHTKLWQQVFGERVKYINDDKPAIRFDREEKAVAYGLPWSGKAFINHNTSAPVCAVVFIERGEENTIRQIKGLEAVCRIVDQTIKISEDKDITNKLLDNAEKFITSVPAYVLRCNMTEEAVKVCYEKIIKE